MRILFILVILLTTGCVSTPDVTNATTDDIKIIKPERPTPVLSPSVNIKVLTPETTQEMLDKQQSFVYYGLDENSYLELAKWLQDALRYIKEQSEIIDYYEEQVDKNGKDESRGSGQ